MKNGFKVKKFRNDPFKGNLKSDDSIYHLKLLSQEMVSFAACNTKSSLHWRKYNKENFMRGTVYNISHGYRRIEGRKCLKCQKLI